MKRVPIRWSEEAVNDFSDILAYIELDSPQRSTDFGKKILKSVRRLASFPESGRIVPELDDQTPLPREIIVGTYRIIYRINSKRVEIVTLIHGRRQLPFRKAGPVIQFPPISVQPPTEGKTRPNII